MGRNKEKRREWVLQYNLKNKEHRKEYNKEYSIKYRQEHKERIAAQHKLYYEKNKEQILASEKKSRQKNIEHYREFRRQYHQKNKARRNLNIKKCNLKRKYNLTPEEVDAMLSGQSFSCLICHGDLRILKRHIDHNHKTGKVRGILCSNCNKGIGMLGENTETLSRAISYLQREDKI